MLLLTHLIWNIVYSLRASSPIWASKASRASTRELAAKQQRLRACSRAGYYLFRYVFLNIRFVNRNCLRHSDVIDFTRNVASLTWGQYPVPRDVPLEFAPAAYYPNTAKGQILRSGKAFVENQLSCILSFADGQPCHDPWSIMSFGVVLV